jgi:hypothetical protein
LEFLIIAVGISIILISAKKALEYPVDKLYELIKEIIKIIANEPNGKFFEKMDFMSIIMFFIIAIFCIISEWLLQLWARYLVTHLIIFHTHLL